MEKSKIKITCPSCNRTDYYNENPNYCAFCGVSLQNFSKNQNKLNVNHNKDNI